MVVGSIIYNKKNIIIKMSEGTLQSILVPKSRFSLEEAKKWILDNKYKVSYYGKQYHETKRYYRFRQHKNRRGKTYYIKKLPNGVKLVFYK